MEEFPVTNKFRAREVTELEYRISPDSPLYVNLDSIRGTEFFEEIKVYREKLPGLIPRDCIE